MGGNYREKLEKAPRNKFCGFNFVARYYIFNCLELGTHGDHFGFNEKR